MPHYIVWRQELWHIPVRVEAATEREALSRVYQGEGEEWREGKEIEADVFSEQWMVEEDVHR